MKTKILNLQTALAALAVFSTLNTPLSTCFAQGTSAFTYNGRLTDNGSVPNGNYDMSFSLLDADTGGTMLAYFTNTPIRVSNGLFVVQLNFGSGVFNGAARWLEIGVRTNGSLSAYTTLTPRQQITPTPYAIFAGTAGALPSGAISNAQIASGQVVKSLNGLKDDVTLLAGTNISLINLGNSNIWINASSGSGDSVWSLNGSSAYYNGGNVGIGTASPGASLDLQTALAAVRFTATGNANGAVLELRNLMGSPTYLGAINFNDSGGTYPGQIGYVPASGMTFRSGGSERLRIATNGNVGIGVTIPGDPLEVVTGVRKVGLNTAIAGVNPGGIASFSNPSSGNKPMLVGVSASPNEDCVLFGSGGGTEVRLVSGGFSSAGFGFYLNQTPTTAFASTRTNPVVKIDGSGNVGIGTASPSAPLHIANRSQSYARIVSTNTQNGSVLDLWNTTPYGPDLPDPTFGAINFSDGINFPGQIAYNVGTGFNFRSGGVNAMIIGTGPYIGIGRTPVANNLEVEGSASKSVAGSWLANSDRRIKRDVEPLTGALDRLERVRLVRFHYTDDYRRAHAGVEDREYLNVIAQEFRDVFPDHVKSSGEKLADGSDILQVDTYPLTIYSAAAIQELDRKLEQKQTEITELKQRLEKLERALEHKLDGGAK